VLSRDMGNGASTATLQCPQVILETTMVEPQYGQSELTGRVSGIVE
jgi:hypothetical protein